MSKFPRPDSANAALIYYTVDANDTQTYQGIQWLHYPPASEDDFGDAPEYVTAVLRASNADLLEIHGIEFDAVSSDGGHSETASDAGIDWLPADTIVHYGVFQLEN